MKVSPILTVILALSLSLPACQHKEGEPLEQQKIVATSPLVKDVTITQQYVCQIHSQRFIDVCALASGYLMKIPVKEGQAVKEWQELFKILPVLYQAKLDAEVAEVQLAQQELNNIEQLYNAKPAPVASLREVLLYKAKLAKAQAKAKLAERELNFCVVTAPFDGIIDRLLKQQGSLIKEGEILTTLSDNSLMWVYFNVPEARYLDYMAASVQDKENQQIELMLASGNKFQIDGKVVYGKIGAIEAKFNNETGNIPFRADFPNPEVKQGEPRSRLLRHGMTGTILIHRPMRNAIIIPQRATFEILDKRYVYVIGKDEKVHQREIAVLHEMEDVFVMKSGLDVDDKFIFEGTRQVRDGQKVEFDFLPPEQIIGHQKNHAE